MKVAYVVPRYGTEVVGGAEFGARMLAERLVSQLGWDVDVLTTCAIDARTWADVYPPGRVELNGVAVHRFPSVAGRHPSFDPFSERLLADPFRAPAREQQRWIDLQGPCNPDVVAAARQSDAEVVVFYPYLYYPTVYGLPAVGSRAVMHPAAHDEPPLRLPAFRPIFAGARGLVFHTWSERQLVERTFGVASTRQLVLGLGVEEGDGDADEARAALSLGDRPYVVCVGRVDDGKGTGMLARLFAAYKDRRPGPLALVLIGPVAHRPPDHPDVVVAGQVDEAVKWGALRGAQLLVQPSAYESFSLVLLEGWAVKTPALVNARCAVTKEHCERSRGGLWFDGYAAFEGALDRLLSDGVVRRRMAHEGANYVARHYRWPVLIERYGGFLREVARRA